MKNIEEQIKNDYFNHGKTFFEIIETYNLDVEAAYNYIHSSKELHSIIPLEHISEEYLVWKNANENFTPFTYLGIALNYEKIITLSNVLYPKIQMIEKCCFLQDTDNWPTSKTRTTAWWDHATDAANLEQKTNFICIPAIFESNTESTTDFDSNMTKEVAKIIELSWNLYFKAMYPQKEIIIDVYNAFEDGWSITFFQKANIGAKKPPLKSILKARSMNV